MGLLCNNRYMFCTITITTNSCEQANAITHLLLTERLVACVQIAPIKSHYIWQGKVCIDDEYRLCMKSRDSLFTHVCQQVRKHHSYQVPEIIATPFVHISPEYQAWLDEVILDTKNLPK